MAIEIEDESIEEMHEWIDQKEERTRYHYRTIMEDGEVKLLACDDDDGLPRIWFEYRGVVVYYHYKDGIGRVRNTAFNTNWGHEQGIALDIRDIAKQLDWEYAIGREDPQMGFIYQGTKQGSRENFVPWPNPPKCAKGCIILAIRRGLLLPPEDFDGVR